MNEKGMSKGDKEVAHVFHCNMRLAEGERANKDQADFLKKIKS